MSDTREASWYEIALTHAQIVKVFVVLLLCLVGAFFSGIWIGRDAAKSVETGGTPLAAAGTAEDGVDGDEVAQLNFFSDDDVVATGTSAQPAIEDPGVGTTLVDDLSAAATAEPEIETQVADAAPLTRGEPDAPVDVTREPAMAGADAEGDLVVQVFSSNDQNQARRVLGRLAQGGHPAYLSPVEVSGRTMYRVRIGPYVDRSRAESVADTVRRNFKLDTWITQKST
jgi:cell division protein FtsN